MEVEKWLLYSMATLLLWGFWGVLLKKASSSLEWYQVYVYANTAIVLFVLLIALIHRDEVTRIQGAPALIAFLSGVTGTLGYIFLVKSLEAGGRASVVIPLTSLYPLLTALLSVYLLGESVAPKKWVGILLAVVAIILLSTE
ncbi:MAG: DMT family transporter [Desulfurococcales archaeon]|nr:DMT family transporter [Desulfurococcales archaeon]